MPPGASASRERQITALAGVLHEKQTSPELGQLLKQLQAAPATDLAGLDPYERYIRSRRLGCDDLLSPPPRCFVASLPFLSENRANVRDALRTFQKETKIPKELSQRLASLTSLGYNAWVRVTCGRACVRACVRAGYFSLRCC